MNEEALNGGGTPLRQSQVTDGVLTLEIYRPEARNALSNAVFSMLRRALREAEGNEDVRVVILTGHGAHFAAGSDIRELAAHTAVSIQTDDREKIWQELSEFSKPLIGAVSGYCFGGGCELAMICDILIASHDAKFAQPEINLGLMPGAGGTQRLPRAVGKSLAMQMALTGQAIDAQRALSAGLVSEVVSEEQLMPRAREIAQTIAQKAPIAARNTKRAIRAGFNVGLQDGLLVERRFFASLFATVDKEEGFSAFLEKRPPRFVGK